MPQARDARCTFGNRRDVFESVDDIVRATQSAIHGHIPFVECPFGDIVSPAFHELGGSFCREMEQVQFLLSGREVVPHSRISTDEEIGTDGIDPISDAVSDRRCSGNGMRRRPGSRRRQKRPSHGSVAFELAIGVSSFHMPQRRKFDGKVSIEEITVCIDEVISENGLAESSEALTIVDAYVGATFVDYRSKRVCPDGAGSRAQCVEEALDMVWFVGIIFVEIRDVLSICKKTHASDDAVTQISAPAGVGRNRDDVHVSRKGCRQLPDHFLDMKGVFGAIDDDIMFQTSLVCLCLHGQNAFSKMVRTHSGGDHSYGW